jgi:hypothetical protein
MSSVNRKLIEEYYQQDWAGVISSQGIETLIEATCKAFKLNLGADISAQRGKIQPHNLGQG